MNTAQLMVFELLMLHEKIELIPYVESYDLFPGNNDPTEVIIFVIVGIPFRNKLGWVEVAKEYWS